MAPWFSRFNPRPSFPPYSGPYSVGTVDFEIAASELHDSTSPPPLVSTVAFRIFYPCDQPSTPAAPVYWVQSPQKSVLSAYARFLGASSALANAIAYFPRLLYWIELPAYRDVPLKISPHENKRWPVLIFSHGLAGSRNSYSHLCASLASYGLVVVAPEHRDGSAPISHVRATNASPASIVEYREISRKASQEAYTARDEQMRIRFWELSEIYQALVRLDSGEVIENLAAMDNRGSKKRSLVPAEDVNSTFKGLLDLDSPGKVSWAGHSFGAATIVQFLKSIYYSAQGVQSHLLPNTPSEALHSQLTPQSPTMLLDLWTMPLNSLPSADLKSKPMPCFDPANKSGGTGTIAILSEAFANWSANLKDVKSTLSDPLSGQQQRPAASIFYPLKSAHLSQSDFGILFPRLIKFVAKADEPERTLSLNVRAVLQTLRNAGLEVAATSVADLELGGDVVAAAGQDDWQILSKEEDAVRGWVAVRADDKDSPLPTEKIEDSKRDDALGNAQSTGEAQSRL